MARGTASDHRLRRSSRIQLRRARGRSSSSSAGPSATRGTRRSRSCARADLGDLAISILILAAYYLLFTVAWQRMLAAWGLRIPYFVALQAEMASILAKYVPGTVWIPAARVAALRRHGDPRHARSCSARWSSRRGSPALAGIIVFLVSLTTVGFSDAPVLPLSPWRDRCRRPPPARLQAGVPPAAPALRRLRRAAASAT